MNAAQFTERINTLSPADRRAFAASPELRRAARAMSLLATAMASPTRRAVANMPSLGRAAVGDTVEETVPLSRDLIAEMRQQGRQHVAATAPPLSPKHPAAQLRRPEAVR